MAGAVVEAPNLAASLAGSGAVAVASPEQR